MRITCPYCGARDAHEFVSLGEAPGGRPDPGAPDAAESFLNYVYLRDNLAGPHHEYWYHGAGCHSWLVVTRDTRSHAILAVAIAGDGQDPAEPGPA